MFIAPTLLLGSVVIVMCVLFTRLSNKIGIPTLLVFIALGMLFGSDGLFKIPFESYELAEQICAFALIFIMFYGGFGTRWSMARPVAIKAALLSSIGVVITAALTGLFCTHVLGMDLLEGLLVGAVLGSTDAASVFSILRSKKLNLKYGTASLLEVESGSNDPFAYMMTMVILSLMSSTDGTATVGNVAHSILSQVLYGVVFGVIIALAALVFLRRFKFTGSGFDTIFVFAIALLAFAVPTLLGGNGYLSTYIVGIIMGNSSMGNKKAMVHFFDGFTGLMQMLIFFLLGLLAFPSQLPSIFVPAFAIAFFLLVIARPVASLLILTPFGSSWQQQVLVSWAGLRGAASIVFAIMVTVSEAYTRNDIFHIAFLVVLFSIAIQGSLLPLVAKKINMIDDSSNVLRTFTDYSDEAEVQFIRLAIAVSHPWCGKRLKEIDLLPNTLVVVVLRDGQSIVPKGDTQLNENDQVVLTALGYHDNEEILLNEITIDSSHEWCNKTIAELPLSPKTLIVMIRRADQTIIPNGDVQVSTGDVLVLYSDRSAIKLKSAK